MAKILLESRYDRFINKIVLTFYDTEKEILYNYVDPTNYKPYCLTNLPPNEFYSFTTQKMMDERNLKPISAFRGNEFQSLPIYPVEKFSTLRNSTEKYWKVLGNTPLDISNRFLNEGKCVNIAKYLLSTDYEDYDEYVVDGDSDDDDNSTLNKFIIQKQGQTRHALSTNDYAWETVIKHPYSYVYDNNLVFGMPYKLQRKKTVIIEPKKCPRCEKTKGIFEYLIKVDSQVDGKGIELWRVSCANIQCREELYLNEDLDIEGYQPYSKIARDFDYIETNAFLTVPVLDEIVIDKEITNDITKAFMKECKEVLDLVKEMTPLFFAKVPTIRRQSMDIEVYANEEIQFPEPDKAKFPVCCVCFVGIDGVRKAYALECWNEVGNSIEKIPSDLEVKIFPNTLEGEKLLLSDVFKEMIKYPILITFNGDVFDLPYMYNRAIKLGLKKAEIPYYIAESKIGFDTSTTIAKFRNIIHLDVYHFFVNKSIKTYAFKDAYMKNNLESVSEALLSKHKARGIREDGKPKTMLEHTKNELIYYCYNDTDLTLELTTYSSELVMKLIFMLMRISETSFTDVVLHPISYWIKNLINFYHRRKDYLIPRKDEIENLAVASTTSVIDGKNFQGAYVFDPIKGIHFTIKVLDFASLYPSAIKIYNLSYETVDVCDHEECKQNIIPETNHWVCKRKRGIFSIVIGVIRDFRVYHFKDKVKELKSKPETEQLGKLYAVIESVLKVFINGSYGVFGSPVFYWFQIAVSDSTTAIGRYSITSVKKEATDTLKLMITGGDTDSIFVKNPTQNDIDYLIQYCDTRLNIQLSVDAEYRVMVMTDRKKNYIGFQYQKDGVTSWDNEKWKKPTMKGVMGKKKNIPSLIKQEFSNVLRCFDENVKSETDIKPTLMKIQKIVRGFSERIRKGDFDVEDLSFSVKLSKDPKHGYTKTIPQHVACARMLLDNGKHIEVGDYVTYVKVRGKQNAVPVELFNDKRSIDHEKYIEQASSVFSQFLEGLGLDYWNILGNFKKLDAFFK